MNFQAGTLQSAPRTRSLNIASFALLVVVVVGFALRLWGLDGRALWLDEAYSKWFSALDLDYLWWLVPRAETHPPLYYSLLKFWRYLGGDSVFALRLPSAIAGCAIIIVTWRAALELTRILNLGAKQTQWFTVIATAYVAALPILVSGARQARPYAFLVLFFSLSLWAFLRLYRDFTCADGRRRPGTARAWLVYFTGLEMVLWLHTLGALFAFCLSLSLLAACLIAGQDRKRWIWFAAGHAIVALLYLPCLLMIAEAAIKWSHSTWLLFSFDIVLKNIASLYGFRFFGGWTVLLLVIAGGFAWRDRQRHPVLPLLLMMAAGPVLLALLISLTIAPVFMSRILSSVAIPTGLLIATLIIAPVMRLVWASAISVLIIFLFAVSIKTLPNMITEDWNAIRDWIEARRGPEDEIWTYPNDASLPLRYAYEDMGKPVSIRQIPADYPALDYPGLRLSGSAAVVTATPEQLRQIASDPALRKVRTIWLVSRASYLQKPNNDLAHALKVQRTQVDFTTFEFVGIAGFRLLPVQGKVQ